MRKGAAELDFLVGELGAPGERYRRVFVAEQDGRALGFITYVPAWGARPGWLHDLTRRAARRARPACMELVNATAVARFAGEGARFLHFGLTPFVVDEVEPDGGQRALARAIRLLGRHAFVYPARTQADYKLKWAPDVVEREWIAFERVSPGAVWALLQATRSLPWPFARSAPATARAARIRAGGVLMSESFDVVVTGAGVGGGAAALAFAQHGLRVLLVEMRPGPGNINRGTSLLPAVTRLLRRRGACSTASARRARCRCRACRSSTTARGLLLEAPVRAAGGHPYLVLDHPDIERVLAEEGRRTGCVTVRYETRVASLAARGPRVAGVETVSAAGAREQVPRAPRGGRRRRRLGGPAPARASSCRRGRTTPATSASTSSGRAATATACACTCTPTAA